MLVPVMGNAGAKLQSNLNSDPVDDTRFRNTWQPWNTDVSQLLIERVLSGQNKDRDI